jgi:mono/diheme cytochrome c family protein
MMAATLKYQALPLVFGMLILSACAIQATGKGAGSAEHGAAVVTQWCATCHTIHGTETEKTRAPTYEQIAARPGRDAVYLRRFLDEDHFPMSTYRLLDTEKDDVVALILSLKK